MEELMRRDNYDPDNATDNERPDHTAPSGQVAAGPATSPMRGSESDIQQQAGEVAERAEQQGASMRDKAWEQAEAGKKRAASGLHSAAEQVRSRTSETEGTRKQAMTKAADTMEKSASYRRSRAQGVERHREVGQGPSHPGGGGCPGCRSDRRQDRAVGACMTEADPHSIGAQLRRGRAGVSSRRLWRSRS
jgi:hypothetical protein